MLAPQAMVDLSLVVVIWTSVLHAYHIALVIPMVEELIIVNNWSEALDGGMNEVISIMQEFRI